MEIYRNLEKGIVDNPKYLYDSKGLPFEVLDIYKDDKRYQRFNLFCPRCYHVWYGVLKGNVKKRGCPYCRRALQELDTLRKLNERIREKDPCTKIVACGKKNAQYFKFYCGNCDQFFYQKWRGKLKLNCTHCSQTSKLNIFQAYQKLTTKWKYYVIFNLDDYISSTKKIWVKCTKCGYFVFDTINNLSHGTCHNCAGSLKKTYKQRYFEVKQASGDLIDLTKLNNGVGTFRCSEGHVFTVGINAFLTSGSNCPICFSSKGEQKIYSYLVAHGVYFERQKHFKTCRDKNPLPFDFYVDNKLLVEFDGVQHFKKVDLFNKTDPFDDRVRRDKIKDTWALENSIPLLRIKYNEIDRTDEILEEKLNDLNVDLSGNAYVGKGETFPDSAAYEFVKGEFLRKGVSLKEIAEEAYEGQKRFNPRLKVSEFEEAIETIMHKREVLNACMVGLNLDNIATKNLLSNPLQRVVQEDNHAFGIDEELAVSICGLYGSVAITQYGYLDLNKTGLASKLDKNANGEVNTFIDDLVSALVACTEAKVMHHNAGTPLED